MNQVKRFRADHRHVVETEFDDAQFVSVADFDALQQRLTVAEQALKFYADGDHLLLADADAWDTCSGEPVNFLHDEAGTASVEDGSIAKAALKPAEEPKYICDGCGSNGWTGNCDKCIPY